MTNVWGISATYCVLGCGRKLALHTRSDICPTCRGTLYRLRGKTAFYLRSYKAKHLLREARMAVINFEKPRATITVGSHEVPQEITKELRQLTNGSKVQSKS